MTDQTPQVLIVTDQSVILSAVSRAYRHKSIEIVTATNVSEALRQLDMFKFDLFLLDLDMKEGLSLNFLTKTTKRFPLAPMILMTTRDPLAHELLAKIDKIRSGNSWQLLEKPFDYKKLVSFISHGLHG